MGEDLGDQRILLLDDGDDLQAAIALRKLFHVDIKHPFMKALPGLRAGRSPFKTVSRDGLSGQLSVH